MASLRNNILATLFGIMHLQPTIHFLDKMEIRLLIRDDRNMNNVNDKDMTRVFKSIKALSYLKENY